MIGIPNVERTIHVEDIDRFVKPDLCLIVCVAKAEFVETLSFVARICADMESALAKVIEGDFDNAHTWHRHSPDLCVNTERELGENGELLENFCRWG